MQIGVGWVRVVGGLRCADRWWVGSVPISVFGGGADLGADLCFWRRLWVVWVGRSLFFFFLVIVAATIFLLVVVVLAAAVVVDEDDDVGGI